MRQLRYLTKATLLISETTIEDNGAPVSSFKELNTYDVQIEKVSDSVSASTYGADITKMYRISSIRKELETYLVSKFNYDLDNISNYFIVNNGKTFKVVSINGNYVDVSYEF